MRAMVMGVAAAVTLAVGGASAATTFQADLAVNRLIGFPDSSLSGPAIYVPNFQAGVEGASSTYELFKFDEG